MKCPFCKEKETSVLDSRPTEDGGVIRRRRICGCERKERFTTFERVQFRDKITKSVDLALRKRPVDIDTKEKLISKIVRDLEGMGENEISTNVIGEMVMQGLYTLDKVAYVRFASVYRDFRETKDFEQFLGSLNKE